MQGHFTSTNTTVPDRHAKFQAPIIILNGTAHFGLLWCRYIPVRTDRRHCYYCPFIIITHPANDRPYPPKISSSNRRVSTGAAMPCHRGIDRALVTSNTYRMNFFSRITSNPCECTRVMVGQLPFPTCPVSTCQYPQQRIGELRTYCLFYSGP